MVIEQEDTSFSFTHKGEKYSGRFRTCWEATDIDFWIWNVRKLSTPMKANPFPVWIRRSFRL